MSFRKSSPVARSAIIGLAVCLTTSSAWAVGRLYGSGRFEIITGQPQIGYQELYEAKLWVTPTDYPPTAKSFRLGTRLPSFNDCYESIGDGSGQYCGWFSAETYSIYLTQPRWFLARPKILHGVSLVDGQHLEVNVELPLDYSTYVATDQEWVTGNTLYQTFQATGIHVVGVAFVLAGHSAGSVNVSVLEDNGDPDVRNWTNLGTRSDGGICNNCDNWVKWRAGEIPTVPGRQYAVKLDGFGGTITPYKRNKGSSSYAHGQAYDANGIAQSYDLNCVVFTDNDGTITTVNKRVQDSLGSLGSGAQKWGQTFVAKGKGLAGCDLFYAGAGTWDVDFEWIIREGGPTGPQIGPTQRTLAQSEASTTGLQGVSYSPGVVPLVKGETYFIEMIGVSSDYTAYVTDDPYEGNSYRWNGASWTALSPAQDLNMTIMEYASMPLIELSRELITRSSFVGDSMTADTFTVANVGFDTLDYVISDDANWLSTNPMSGSSDGETDTITVNYSVENLSVGEHEATITVTGYDTEGSEAVNSPQTIGVYVTITSVGPDFDGDTDVDLDDFGHLQACYSGDGIPQPDPDCQDADLNGDGSVGQNDYLIFAGCMTGEGIPAERTCAE